MSDHSIGELAENCRAQASTIRFECNALDRTGGLYNASEAQAGRHQAALLDEAAAELLDLDARVVKHALALGIMYGALMADLPLAGLPDRVADLKDVRFDAEVASTTALAFRDRLKQVESERVRYATILGRMFHLATGAEDGTLVDPDAALDALTKLRRHNVQMFRALEQISLLVDPTGAASQSVDQIVRVLKARLFQTNHEMRAELDRISLLLDPDQESSWPSEQLLTTLLREHAKLLAERHDG